ncbi:hypothetical protein HZA97_00690 [Candidatus Woesearchaeota archaeon]|nr:hypothetical protein [Candidatus Woesearchaeota archaeon]
MQDKKTIEDHFNGIDKHFNNVRSTVKAGFIGAGVGLVVGIAGGIYLGESINDYVEALKQAPKAIQYAVDAGSAFLCGSAGAGVGAAIGQLPGLYRMFKEFF